MPHRSRVCICGAGSPEKVGPLHPWAQPAVRVPVLRELAAHKLQAVLQKKGQQRKGTQSSA